MNVEDLNNERKRQHLSVAELAEKANLPKGTVEKILFGIVKNPRIDTMQSIERALGIDEKSQIMDRPMSAIAENFIREYGEFFSDETFQSYARLYKVMTIQQRIFVLGLIAGYLEDKGINVKKL